MDEQLETKQKKAERNTQRRFLAPQPPENI